MSFSSDVKTELCKTPPERPCCAAAECYGALLYGNAFNAREIRIITGNRDFAARLPLLFKLAHGVSLAAPSLKGGKLSFALTDQAEIRGIFEAYGYEPEAMISHHINLAVLEEDCCRQSFVRGAFLSGGSVTNPTGRYHLELVTGHLSVSRETFAILLDIGMSPKETLRAGNYVTYFKQSEAIEEFLNVIGAPESGERVALARKSKELSGDVNRRVNCDYANADKIVAAAQQQLEAIRTIERTIGLHMLPENVYSAALLRIANPEASLKDMAALADPPVSKASMSHRLRRLVTIAEQRDI